MIRPGDPGDVPAMAQVLRGWTQDTPWMPKLHSADDDAGFCAGLMRRAAVWVADTRAGFGFVARDGTAIPAFYLDPAIRGQGWGKLLLEQAKFGQSRLSLWAFQANRGAIRFYEREGFAIAGMTDGAGNVEGLPDAHMIWERGLG